MQDTPALAPVTTAISFALLHAQFAALPDPRRAQGRRFPPAALLTLAVAAILANHLSVLAIAEWGAAQSAHVRRALGFTGDRMPHQTTLHRLFARLDARLLAATLARALADAQGSVPPPRGAQAIAVDGKAQRGRLAGQPIDATWSPVHMLSASATKPASCSRRCR
jgi:hypothetical protein